MANPQQRDMFDGMLLNIAQQTGGIQDLLDVFFSFLARKTDFFIAQGVDPQGVVMDRFKYHRDQAMAAQREKMAEDHPEPSIQEIPEEPAPAAAPAAATKQPEPEPAPEPELSMVDESDEEAAGKGLLKPTAGNGAVYATHSFTQTLQDLEVRIPLGPGKFRGKDCLVDIRKNHVKAGLKGKPPILDGELDKAIKPDDSTWLISDGNVLVLELQKVDRMQWWPRVLKTDASINTKAVQPENSKLSDLDDETRAMVEKMQFDQRQKEMGKPTSDELLKQQKLQDFMKAHPEMDFSNVKFS